MSTRGSKIGGAILALGVVVGLAASSPVSAAGPVLPTFPTGPASADVDYRIGALDRLNITVFQIKDLTVEKMQVDASGRILLPLIGSVMARGKTTTELSDEIATRLAGKYLQSPQVSVTVEEAVSQKVSVEGAVNEAGVFELKGRTSLLEAVARAKGAAKNANLHHVTIIRSVDGAPHAATFDLAAIGQGRARNPEVVGNDIVIVDDSKAKNLWKGIVEALPALYVFSFL
jgi:polysaccharide export outer membrane protein